MKRVYVMDEFGGEYLRAIFEEVGIDIIVLLNENSYETTPEELDKLYWAIANAVDEGCESEEELTEVIGSLMPKNDPDGLGLECLTDGFTVIVRPIIK